MRFRQADITRMGILLFVLMTLHIGNMESFLSLGSHSSAFPYIAITAIGLMALMITGGIDLSIGSVMALAAAVFAYSLQEGASLVTSLICALVFSGFFSFINGLIAYESKQPTIIVTLIITVIFSFFIKSLSWGILGESALLPIEIYLPEFLPIDILRLIATFICILFLFWGKRAYATEEFKEWGNLKKAYPRLTIYGLYFLAGLLFATAGILLSMRVSMSTHTIGIGYEITAFIAVMLGGASLKGGKGNIVNAIIGAAIISKIQLMMITSDWPFYYSDAVLRLILLALVIADIVMISLKKENTTAIVNP